DILAQNEEGKTANFYGNYIFDTFNNAYLFQPDQIEFIEADDKLKDDAPRKRIELHVHTNRSEMDGVCDAGELVKAAYDMGHDAIAITDHVDVQAFPTAQHAADKLNKKGDRKIRILYGCEMNMVDSKLNLVYNPKDLPLQDSEYCVLDLETTGLSTRHDYMIEFGAVILHRGITKQRKDFFCKPPIEVPRKIRELTNITEAHLRDARPFKECVDELKEFIGDRVIVAHNAAFDFGFLNEELIRNGFEPLANPVIDTLDLARSLFSNRRSYRLGNIARQYNVSYDEAVAHRADYDAEVLAQVFHLMLKDLKKLGIEDLLSLSQYQTEDAFIKNREYHTTVMVRNKEGLKDLFKLVSISNTTQLAIFGKANTKSEDSQFVVEPRIFRETLQEYRKNLLIGSACCNGEIFELAHTRSEEALAKAISFYDYIEIQPLENYRHLLERGSFDEERLKTYLRDIIAEAKKQGKIIVATGDVHYVTEEEKIFRDVYINAQGIGGVHHPLYIYDKERRKTQVSPDQHFRNTEEMLEAFAWLDDPAFVEEVVIDNPHKILDLCEEVTPIHDKLYTPVIEGSSEKLTEIVYRTAHEIYGDPLDPIIEERLKKELDSIIGNGYGVIYYVSHLLVKRSNQDGYLVGSRGS
ncbi:MAG: PHP domain-containing protein, partial [Erysipelotrichaceae bacterium]|nr:PHP domain-containing protein [Erysipelotrichaceae bacterium]